MNRSSPTKLIASCCGLSAFSVATIAGLGADNAADVILSRAVTCMVVCYLLGIVIGRVAERAIEESLESYRARRPIGGAARAESGASPDASAPG